MTHAFHVFRMSTAGADGIDETSSSSSSSGNHRALASRRTRALVIDDSDTARAGVARILRLGGCQVHELPSAIGASRLALRENIELAVVDISMPGLSGDKLIQVFRNNARLKSMVIIIVSGQSAEELASVAQDGLADAVLPKSQIHDDLIPLLQRLMPGRFPSAILPAGTGT